MLSKFYDLLLTLKEKPKYVLPFLIGLFVVLTLIDVLFCKPYFDRSVWESFIWFFIVLGIFQFVKHVDAFAKAKPDDARFDMFEESSTTKFSNIYMYGLYLFGLGLFLMQGCKIVILPLGE